MSGNTNFTKLEIASPNFSISFNHYFGFIIINLSEENLDFKIL